MSRCVKRDRILLLRSYLMGVTSKKCEPKGIGQKKFKLMLVGEKSVGKQNYFLHNR